MASTQADLELKYRWTVFGSACDTHRPGLRRCTLTHSRLATTKTLYPALWDSLITKETLVNTGIKFNPWPLPPPQPSTFCHTNFADSEDDKKRERLSPARADKTDKASNVTKGLPHLSPSTSLLRDISNKLRSEI